AARVDPLEERVVALVVALEAEAHDRERTGRAQLPTVGVRHPALELLRQLDGAPDVALQTAPSVAAEHRPQLERAEAPAERRPVLAQAECVLGVWRAQVLGDQAERAAEVVGAAR